MNTTATNRFRPQGRAELSCLYCGHTLGEVRVPRGRRPTNIDLRAAYAATPDVLAPAWDAHGAPRCPRCAARLFVELSDRPLRVDADRV
jgi:DNA-directed RNA polymerase subunit RPC12/RpoP